MRWFLVLWSCLVFGANASDTLCQHIPASYQLSLPVDRGVHESTSAYESFWYTSFLNAVSATDQDTSFALSFDVDRCGDGCAPFSKSTWRMTLTLAQFNWNARNRKTRMLIENGEVNSLIGVPVSNRTNMAQGIVDADTESTDSSFFSFNNIHWEMPEMDAQVNADPYVIRFGKYELRQDANDSRVVTLHGELHGNKMDLRLERVGNVSQINHISSANRSCADAVHLLEPWLKTTGTITLSQKIKYQVMGNTFHDHYWTPATCTFFFNHWWKYLALHLSNGYSIQVVQSSLTLEPALYLMYPHGGRVYSQPARLKATCFWRSPRSNISYPVCHQITTERDLVFLHVTPLVVESEIYYQQQPAIYEGASIVVGMINHERVVGTGFTELHGFKK